MFTRFKHVEQDSQRLSLKALLKQQDANIGEYRFFIVILFHLLRQLQCLQVATQGQSVVFLLVIEQTQVVLYSDTYQRVLKRFIESHYLLKICSRTIFRTEHTEEFALVCQ